jgi:hypothetical protein
MYPSGKESAYRSHPTYPHVPLIGTFPDTQLLRTFAIKKDRLIMRILPLFLTRKENLRQKETSSKWPAKIINQQIHPTNASIIGCPCFLLTWCVLFSTFCVTITIKTWRLGILQQVPVVTRPEWNIVAELVKFCSVEFMHDAN